MSSPCACVALALIFAQLAEGTPLKSVRLGKLLSLTPLFDSARSSLSEFTLRFRSSVRSVVSRGGTSSSIEWSILPIEYRSFPSLHSSLIFIHLGALFPPFHHACSLSDNKLGSSELRKLCRGIRMCTSLEILLYACADVEPIFNFPRLLQFGR